MSIYDPTLFLTSSDRELLRLLSELALEWAEGSRETNYASDTTPLSQAESELLLQLLEEFVSSKRFVEGSYLIEKIFGGETLYDRELRDLYLSWRKRAGKSRAVASIQWENLLGRIGIWTTDRGNPQVWYKASASPMTLSHFMKMETKLAASAQIHPRVRMLLFEFVQARLAEIEEVRFGRKQMREGQIASVPKSLLSTLRVAHQNGIGLSPVPKEKLVGVMTIVMDFAVLYTTRDWSVAGFLSTVAGATPLVVLD